MYVLITVKPKSKTTIEMQYPCIYQTTQRRHILNYNVHIEFLQLLEFTQKLCGNLYFIFLHVRNFSWKPMHGKMGVETACDHAMLFDHACVHGCMDACMDAWMGYLTGRMLLLHVYFTEHLPVNGCKFQKPCYHSIILQCNPMRIFKGPRPVFPCQWFHALTHQPTVFFFFFFFFFFCYRNHYLAKSGRPEHCCVPTFQCLLPVLVRAGHHRTGTSLLDKIDVVW